MKKKYSDKILMFIFIILFLFNNNKVFANTNDYKIDLKVQSRQRHLIGNEEITIFNNSKEDLDKIYLYLGLNNSYDTRIDINEVTNLEGVVLPSGFYKYKYLGKEIEDKTVYQVTLANKLLPNESIILKIRFEVNNIAKINNITFLDDNINNLTISAWYPRIINFENGIWQKKDFIASDYQVTVTTDDDEFSLSSGIEINSEKLKSTGDKRITYKMNNTRAFSLLISDYISSDSEKLAEGLNLKVYYKNNKAYKFNKNIIDSAKEIISFYYKKLGMYPYKQINILPNNSAIKPAYANNNFIILNENYEKYDSFKEFESKLKWDLAYTLAQQYFGYYVGESSLYPKWITSGASLYMANSYIKEKNIANDNFNKYIKQYINAAKTGFNTKVLQEVDNIKNTDFDWENTIEKGKAAQIFKLLEYRLGRKVLNDSLKDILVKHANSFINTDNFENILEEKSSKKLDNFFEQLVKDNKRLDYAITKITQTKIGSKYQIKLYVKRIGKIIMPVSIGINFKNGNKVFQIWDGEKSEEELTYEYNEPVKSAQIDPAESLPDIDLSNNLASVLSNL